MFWGKITLLALGNNIGHGYKSPELIVGRKVWNCLRFEKWISYVKVWHFVDPHNNPDLLSLCGSFLSLLPTAIIPMHFIATIILPFHPSSSSMSSEHQWSSINQVLVSTARSSLSFFLKITFSNSQREIQLYPSGRQLSQYQCLHQPHSPSTP